MKTLFYNCKISWVSIILFLVTCPVIGQVKKTKQLTEDDYHLWSTLKAESVSDQGNWASYSLSYESGLDTLFVKNTAAAMTFAFAKGYNGKFLAETGYGCMLSENVFEFLDLTTGEIQHYENIETFLFSDNGQYIILYYKGLEDKIKIVIRNPKGDSIESVDNVTSYSISPDGNLLGYCTSETNKNTVGLLQFGKKVTKTTVIQNTEKQFENIIWQAASKSLAFVGRLAASKPFTADTVLFYSLGNKQLFQYDTSVEKTWKKDRILDANYISSLGISDDGKKVFFRIRKKPDETLVKNDLGVQIWNAADTELSALRSHYGNLDIARLASWKPENNCFLEIGDDAHPAAMLSGNQQFALVYNPDTNKPTFKQEADIDYYLLDLKTGLKTLFLKQQLGTSGNLFLSPKGKYVVYFRERNWWIYSFASAVHTNITLKKGVSFYDDSNDEPQEPNPYGCAGFTANDESVLLYDQFDIWEFKPNGGIFKKLTSGREKEQIFRLADTDRGNIDNVVFKSKVIDFKHNLLLSVQAFDHSQSGYFNLDQKRQVRQLVFEPKKVHSLHKAKTADSFMYVHEDFNEPPSLVFKKDNASSKIIYKSNLQHAHYGWGKSELIEYKNSKGAVLKGVLFYPFDYNPQQQYPMIVHVYQKQTRALHAYVNPTLLNGSSFNPAYYTSQGYFALLPDIVYEIGRPGFSASDCVIAATNRAIETASIDRTKIGLTGNSYGGYETDFIITQTGLFAAAAAGSGISDLISGYLSMNVGYNKTNSWRYEYQQFRMGKTLFEDYEGYQKNSPIHWVSNVATPLLSYSGAGDTQVNPSQTMEFYYALRRLEKKHIMLLYPKENHEIQGRENQIDLTHKMSDWFGYYLKGDKKPVWFEPK
jgi:dipeptidyl aminopeptidase/acylaminoacyl peptidase